MTELRHLQLVILSIMRDLDKLCKSNGIEYYLLGGSAIGAIRHQGFIPWDDDLDIMMTPKNYERFLDVCRTQLDKNKYYLMVGLEDYPLNFSKVKLKGTHLTEKGVKMSDSEHDGIYIDVFKLENAPSSRFSQWIQYVEAKYFLCYQLSKRGFEEAGLKKRIMMALALPLKWDWFRNRLKDSIEKYGNGTEYYGSFYFRTRFRNAFTKKNVFGKPILKKFEDVMLPVPEHYHEYLTQMFGDYMTPPPVDAQVGYHLVNVDFGEY